MTNVRRLNQFKCNARKYSNAIRPRQRTTHDCGTFEKRPSDNQLQISLLKNKLEQAKYALQGINKPWRVNEQLSFSVNYLRAERDAITIAFKKMIERAEVDLNARADESRSAFFSRASHELRTPLNAILGFGQLMLSDDNDTHYLKTEQRVRLEGIKIAGQQLLTLLDDMLDLTPGHIGPLDIVLEPIDLSASVTKTVEQLGDHRERNTKWKQKRFDTCWVLADQTALLRILQSVLEHAFDNCSTKDAIEIRLSSDTDKVNFCVKYKNIAKAPLIPQTPSSSPSEFDLLEAKTLAELMSGTVSIHQNKAGFISMEIMLPQCASRSESRRCSASNLPSRTSCAPHRILYIEDNPVNAMMMKQVIAKEPQWIFSIATNGTEGIKLAESTRPSLILMDMQLGDMTGVEVFSVLKEKNILPPYGCIALSADVLPAHINEALDAGFANYWTKPLNFKFLMDELNSLLTT